MLTAKERTRSYSFLISMSFDEGQKVMDKILKYNQEDLEATWTLLKWLRSKLT